MIRYALIAALLYVSIGCLIMMLADIGIYLSFDQPTTTGEKIIILLLWPYYLYGTFRS